MIRLPRQGPDGLSTGFFIYMRFLDAERGNLMMKPDVKNPTGYVQNRRGWS